MERPSAKVALRKMQESQYYSKIHKINKEENNKISEILFEKGNYAWGGYEAILIIETDREVKIYSYLPHKEGFRFCEGVIDKKVYMNFADELTEDGLWQLANRFYNPLSDAIVDDGSTYFLNFSKGKEERQVIVYCPEMIKGAKKHWDIIRKVKEFGLRYTCL